MAAIANDDTKLTIVLDTKLHAAADEVHEGATATAMSSPPSPSKPAPRNVVQWLRAAVLGASDGLVSTASLILGVGAAHGGDDDDDARRAVLLAGLAGLVAGACSMAIGEYVSVHAQLDVELAELKRAEAAAAAAADGGGGGPPESDHHAGLSSTGQAAAASALAFAAGGGVPLLAAWFISGYRVRVVVVVVTASVTMAVFGSLGAVMGRAPGGRAGLRALVGGLVAMGITYGLMKLFRIHSV